MDLKEDILYLTRFCGVEQYPVKTAAWYIMKGDGTEDNPGMLCLEVTFGVGNVLHEDIASLKAEPEWKIDFPKLEIPVGSLQPGFCLEQPNEDEDIDGNLYYVEFQPTMDNMMKIIAVDGDRLKIHLTGVTEDVNYYDGSKPKSTMQLVTWFNRER